MFIIFLFCFDVVFKRWRPLEAALAAIGSQAEAVEECISDEEVSGRDKPIDVEFLLSNVVPSVLSLSGTLLRYLTQDTVLINQHRTPLPPGERLCIR